MIVNQVPKCSRNNGSEETEKSGIFEQQNDPQRVENKQFFKGVFQVPQKERVNLCLFNIIICEN